MEFGLQHIYYWLGISGITSRRANILLEKFSPYELWEKTGNSLIDRSAFGEKAYDALLRFRSEEFIFRSMDKLDSLGISFITYDEFPEKMQQRETDPPVMLYYRGDVSLLKSDCAAIVCTRACSPYGKDAAKRLANDLSERGVTIVSGLATGIDTYAHRAVLAAGGKTIAVLGSGLDCISPLSNSELGREIIDKGGLVVSEYAPRTVATKYTFPERNRIISAISSGVIVVEAGLKSGALITADFALEQNRTLFAVPGNITSIKSVGSNRLLYEGAVPALTADDICETLGFSSRKISEKPIAIQLDIFEQKIYNILRSGETSFDELVVKAELIPPKLSAMLSAMEIKGLIVKKQSNIFCLA